MYIDQTSINVIKNSALNQFPNECCGFLWGNENEVIFAREVENVSDKNKKESFSISHLDYLAAEKYADEHKLSLLGTYHSHPNEPALLSQEDIEFAMPNFLSIIVSVDDDQVKEILCWQLTNNKKIIEHKIEIKCLQS